MSVSALVLAVVNSVWIRVRIVPAQEISLVSRQWVRLRGFYLYTCVCVCVCVCVCNDIYIYIYISLYSPYPVLAVVRCVANVLLMCC